MEALPAGAPAGDQAPARQIHRQLWLEDWEEGTEHASCADWTIVGLLSECIHFLQPVVGWAVEWGGIKPLVVRSEAGTISGDQAFEDRYGLLAQWCQAAIQAIAKGIHLDGGLPDQYDPLWHADSLEANEMDG